MPLYGDGQNVRDWIHVDDHCQALIEVLLHGSAGQSYNIGANNEHSNIELNWYVENESWWRQIKAW